MASWRVTREVRMDLLMGGANGRDFGYRRGQGLTAYGRRGRMSRARP
jgi:hypothetical protein